MYCEILSLETIFQMCFSFHGKDDWKRLWGNARAVMVILLLANTIIYLYLYRESYGNEYRYLSITSLEIVALFGISQHGLRA